MPALEAAGYVLRIREPNWYEHRLFKGPDTAVNVHVFSPGCVEVERMLAFRDHLRADAGDRALYERTKRQLAARRWKYVQHYADAKSAVVGEIVGPRPAARRRALTFTLGGRGRRHETKRCRSVVKRLRSTGHERLRAPSRGVPP